MEDLNLSSSESTEEVVTPQEEQATPNVESVNEEITTSQQTEKPVQTPEDNARFADIRRKTESETRDKVIAEMYGESHGIKTYADYQAAVKQAEEQARQEELRNQGIDPEVFNKYIEENPTVKQSKAIIEQQNRQQYLGDQVKALEEYAPGIDLSKLDPSIVKEFEAGKPLVDAYAKWENKNLRAELEAFKKGSATLETNNKNALSSPGSTTGNGTGGEGYITKSEVEANRNNPKWIKANLTSIEESMKKW